MSSDKRNSAIFDAFALASDNIWETRFTCHVVRNARTCASTSSSSLHFRYAYDMMSSSSAHWRGCVVGGGVCIIVSASIGGVCMELSTSHGVCIEDSELLPAMFSLTPHLSSPLKCRD